MKVLLYGINFSPELTGTGKYSGEMAEWLARHGHAVDVVTAPPYYPQWRVSEGFSAWKYQRHEMPDTNGQVQILRCPLWVPRKVTGAARLMHLASFAVSSTFGLIWGLARKPDLVFVVVPTLMQTPQAVVLSKLAGAPNWLHVQDFEVDAALDMHMVKGAAESGGLLRRMSWWLESYWMRRFDRVSSITPAMVKRLLVKGVEADRVVELPNWVSLDSVFPISRAESMRHELGIADDQVVVLYSGNMGEKQGLDLLVEAAERLRHEPTIRFVLAGTGAARARLEKAAVSLGNVTWLPLQPIEKLNALLGSADVHVLPQRADAADLVMPSKLTGMLASGRAIVGTAALDTQLGGILSKVGVRVEPGDADGLAQALKALAQDPARREELGQKGRRFAEETLDKNAILRQFLQDATALHSQAPPRPRFKAR
ncbi:MAG: glycosyltransferase WbuB [Burkholderiales bacterium]|nr:glycosyltransferase WbuB [Burkholderiales bacterium]